MFQFEGSGGRGRIPLEKLIRDPTAQGPTDKTVPDADEPETANSHPDYNQPIIEYLRK